MKWVVLIVLLFSAALTYYLMDNGEQFYVVDQQVLSDPTFKYADRYWKKQKAFPLVSYTGDGVRMEHPLPDSNQVSQHVKVSSPVYVRLSAEARGMAIVSDDRFWTGGTAAIVSYGHDGSRLWHANGFILKNPAPFRAYSKIFRLNKDVGAVEVAIRLLSSQGQFSVRNPQLSILAEFPHFKIARNLLILYWGAVAVCLLVWAFRIMASGLVVWISGLSIIVLAGVLMPGAVITAFNDRFFGIFPVDVSASFQGLLIFFIGATETAGQSVSLSKLAHFLFFLIFGMLTGRAFRRIGTVFGVALIAVAAIVTESLQTLVFGRTASLRDIYLDLSGGLTGLAISISCIVFMEKLSHRHS